MTKAYKIVGGPLPWDVKVYDPDGKELADVVEVSIAPITTNGEPVRVDIRVQAVLDLNLEGDAINLGVSVAFLGYEFLVVDHEWPFGTMMQAEPREPGWYLLERFSNRFFGPYDSPAIAEAAVPLVATQLKAEHANDKGGALER